jgi:hypothetical protein
MAELFTCIASVKKKNQALNQVSAGCLDNQKQDHQHVAASKNNSFLDKPHMRTLYSYSSDHDLGVPGKHRELLVTALLPIHAQDTQRTRAGLAFR